MNRLASTKIFLRPLFSRRSWKTLGAYLGFGKRQTGTVTDISSLAEYIQSRASHVTQTTLYGYLRTRAGTRYPELFQNPDILQSINIAKWHIWIACVSDLSLFIGQLAAQAGINADRITGVMTIVVDQILHKNGVPEEAGDDFIAATQAARERIQHCDWSVQEDSTSLFSQSPEALHHWSPIADQLKERDESIVRNSVRFHWIDVRRNSRKQLDIAALFKQPSADLLTD